MLAFIAAALGYILQLLITGFFLAIGFAGGKGVIDFFRERREVKKYIAQELQQPVS